MERKEFLKVLGLGTLFLRPDALAAEARAGAGARKRVLRIAHLTDVHIQPELGAPEGLARCLHHVQALDDPADVIFNGGDTIMDALREDRARVKKQWDVWHSVVRSENDLPIEHCIGNHDVWGQGPAGDPLYGKRWAMDEMGLVRPYRSFDRAGWHFIVLDSTHPVEGGWYTAKLDDEQFAWLKADLEATPSSTPVMVVSHIPILTATSFMIGDQAKSGDWEIPGSWMHVDARPIAELLSERGNVKVCASGHMHMVDRVDYRGVSYICNGAVSGGWWKGPYWENYAGYALIDLFDDGSFERTYVQYGWTPRSG